MELQIQDLVTAIKKDGVDQAKKDAEKIISEANDKAQAIVSQAKEQASKTISAAEKEIAIMRESAKLSAQQALRDASITFEKEVQKAFNKVLTAELKKDLSSEVVGKLVVAALNQEDPNKYQLEIAEVNDALKAQLADQIKQGLEIKVGKANQKGFKLAAKDGSGYFDLSEDEIVQMVSNFMGEINI